MENSNDESYEEVIEQTEPKKKKDKRSETSRKNLEKARQAKLAKLKKLREEKKAPKTDVEYVVDEYSSDSDSDSSEDEEPILYVKNPKKTKKAMKEKDDRIEELNKKLDAFISQGQTKKKKPARKKPARKTVVQIVNPAPVEKSKTAKKESIERQLLKF